MDSGRNQIIGLTKINGNGLWHRSSNIITSSSIFFSLPSMDSGQNQIIGLTKNQWQWLVTQVQQHHHGQQQLHIHPLFDCFRLKSWSTDIKCLKAKSNQWPYTGPAKKPLATFAGELVPSEESPPSLIALDSSLESGYTWNSLNEKVADAGGSMPCHVLKCFGRFFILSHSH